MEFDKLTKSWIEKKGSVSTRQIAKQCNTKMYPTVVRDFNLWSNPTRLNDGRIAMTIDSVKSTSLVTANLILVSLFQ